MADHRTTGYGALIGWAVITLTGMGYTLYLTLHAI